MSYQNLRQSVAESYKVVRHRGVESLRHVVTSEYGNFLLGIIGDEGLKAALKHNSKVAIAFGDSYLDGIFDGAGLTPDEERAHYWAIQNANARRELMGKGADSARDLGTLVASNPIVSLTGSPDSGDRYRERVHSTDARYSEAMARANAIQPEVNAAITEKLNDYALRKAQRKQDRHDALFRR